MLAMLGVGAGGGLLNGHAAVGVEVDFVFGCFVGVRGGSRIPSSAR